MAWQLDNAVLTFGRHVEHELEHVKGKTEAGRNFQRRKRLADLLGMEKPVYVFHVDGAGRVQ